jgi:TatD DNase family protein
MNLLIDTHAHVNFREYKEDGDEVIKRSLKNGVWLINVGAERDTSKRAVEYSEGYPEGVFSAVGLHPFHVKDQKFSYEKYKELALKEKVVAIGEIGLDYYHVENGDQETKLLQKQLFLEQLDLAEELKKPIIIHCREAHRDIIDILKSKVENRELTVKGVAHSFLGNFKQAREYRQLGFKIAFNGIITFARDYDKVILDTPLDDILLETDCPYLTPVPYRGQRNEPLYVIEVAKKLAEIKKIPLEEVVNQTTANAKKVFNLV